MQNSHVQTGNSISMGSSVLRTLALCILLLSLPVSVASSTTVDAELTFRAEDVRIVQEHEYDIIGYVGAVPDWAPDQLGHPQLPTVLFRFLLPPKTRVADVSLTVLEADTLEGTYCPYPIQPDPMQGGQFFPPDPQAYGGYEPYPPRPGRLVADGYFRTYHCATLKVYPLLYIGHTDRIVLIKRAHVAIELRQMDTSEEAALFHRLRQDHRPWSERPESRWIDHLVYNPDALGSFYDPSGSGIGSQPMSVTEENPFGGFRPTEFPSLEGPPIEYVIITDSLDTSGNLLGAAMVSHFQELADWKTSKGVPAVVRTVSWINEHYAESDLPAKIRAFIKDAAARWGTNYVMLGGDAEIVPPRLIGDPDADYSFIHYRVDPPADMYYGELDHTWNDNENAYYAEYDPPDTSDMSSQEYLDLWVGRIPARNAAEAEVIVDKILSYERAPGASGSPDTSYYNNVLLVAGPVHTPGSSLLRNGIVYAESLLAAIVEDSTSFDMDVTRLYPEPPDTILWCEYELRNKRCYEFLYDFLGSVNYSHFTAQNFRAELNSGHGFVWHREHSNREKLGDVSFLKDPSCPTTSWQNDCQLAFKNANPGAAGDLHSDIVDRLDNAPNYSVVLTSGCHTNQWDLDAVGEHFVRAPDGGAVAYFGKISAQGSFHLVPITEFFHNVFERDSYHLGEVTGLATNACTYPTGAGITWSLLGDPEMQLWTQAPGQLSLSVTPGTFARLGAQTVEVEVKDFSSDDAIEGARVCLKQSDVAYAVAWTDADGEAIFPSFTPQDSSATWIHVTARNYKPERTRILVNDLGMPHYIAYVHHTRDDDVAGGDGDDVLEAGETVELRILTKNLGHDTVTPAQGVWAHLWPTAPIIFDLDMTGDDDEAYEPENIFIGAEGGHPHWSLIGDTLRIPAMGDTFRIPANWEGIRPEGEPDPGALSAGAFFLWRDHTALWHLETRYAGEGENADSVFAGILVTEGAFDSVVCHAEFSPGPDWFVHDPNVNPDSITFHFEKDATDDLLEFRAEASDWIDVITDSVRLGTMAGQDTASGVFDVSLTTDIPDLQEVIFTLAVRDTASEGVNPNWWFSDFSVSVHSPEVRHLLQRVKTSDTGDIYTAKIWPTLSNTGSADADSAVLVLTNATGGVFGNMDTVVCFSTIQAGSTAVSDSLYLAS
ncbi:MAG: hypothetical protein KAY24_17090, partial [Candidatus Eisenbacteria sp.]|nr:hypothetical protein [Candidatus Eisenbacteria bacterium]